MRLSIQEQLDRYNETVNGHLSMRQLALIVYQDEDTIDQTKINRLSALNTGRTVASIKDLVLISEALACECTDLIHVP